MPRDNNGQLNTEALNELRARIDQLIEIVKGPPHERARYITESNGAADSLGQRLLAKLRATGEMTFAELVHATGSATSAVGRACKGLAAQGLVRLVSEETGDKNTFRWVVCLPEQVTLKRRRTRLHSDLTELGARLPTDEDLERWAEHSP